VERGGASRSDTAMGAIAAAAEETGDAAAHLGEAQHGRKGRKQGPHRRGERRAKAMGAAALAAAGGGRGGGGRGGARLEVWIHREARVGGGLGSHNVKSIGRMTIAEDERSERRRSHGATYELYFLFLKSGVQFVVSERTPNTPYTTHALHTYIPKTHARPKLIHRDTPTIYSRRLSFA